MPVNNYINHYKMSVRIVLLLLLAYLPLILYSQGVPQAIKYQAIARNQNGSICANQNINIRASIIDSAAGGITVYTEIHKSGTNQFGLFSIAIGYGINTTGSFSGIQWATGRKWLKIEMDPIGGNNYQLMGKSELLSVPYAQYAGNVVPNSVGIISNLNFDPNTNELTVTEDGISHITTINEEADNLDDNVLNDLSDVGTNPSQNQVLKWDGTQWVSSDDETNDQTIAIISHVLTITDGNSVDLSIYLDNTDDQVISFDPTTNILTLEDGGTIDLSSLINDLDPDPVNEIQDLTLSGRDLGLTGSGVIVTLPSTGGPQGPPGPQGPAGTNGVGVISTIDNGNGTFTINYSDGSSFTSSDLTGPSGIQGIQGNPGDPGPIGPQGPPGNPATDDQTLSLNGDTLSISNGNIVVLPDGVNDADADPTNELQTLSFNGDTIFISNSNYIVIPGLSCLQPCDTTIGCPLPSPPIANPATDIMENSFTANWTIVSGAASHHLDVATDSGFTSMVFGFDHYNAGTSSSQTVWGLACNTTYYIRLDAQDACGESIFSNVISVTTLMCPLPIPCPDTIIDIDGNVYSIVQIDSQCWFANNLTTSRYQNGDPIPTGYSDAQWAATNSGAYTNAGNPTFGKLYNWHAINDARGICPQGWHIPSDNEWKTLEIYLGMSQAQANMTGLRGSSEGGKLKETGTTNWSSPNVGATNSTGFTALPAGNRYGTDGTFHFFSEYAFFWSSNESNSTYGWARNLYYGDAGISRIDYTKEHGLSCRCVRD